MVRFLLAFIPILVLFLLAFVLGKYNAEEVSVNLLVWQSSVSTGALLATTLLVGFVLGILVISVSYIKLRWRNRKLRKALIHFSKPNSPSKVDKG